jgi:signal transduction histidine kinase
MSDSFSRNILLENLGDDIVRETGISIEACQFGKGEVIFSEGDHGNCLYLVSEGLVSITKRKQDGKPEELVTVGPRDFFGELSTLDGEARSATATALEDCTLGKIDRDSFERYISHSPETALRFACHLSDQLRNMNVHFIDKILQSEKLNLLGTMMTSIVHDFRNPLATMSMLSQYLQGRDDDSRLMDLGRIASESLEQIDVMITELLDFSRGTSQLKVKDVAIPDLVSKLDEQILSKVEGYGFQVAREIDCKDTIRVDPHRIMRLLTNIIRNAWESMERNGTLTIRIHRQDDHVIIEIEDTGCGIPADILAQVFEPFVTHGKAKGTGLGMAIAKSVVEAHEGTIEIESEVDKGTRCTISLPA